MRKLRAPHATFATAPAVPPKLVTEYVVPNCHAHLSAFSLPAESYQAVPSSSVSVAASSWERTDAMASNGGLSLGEADPTEHDDMHCVCAFPMKENFTTTELYV